MTLGGFSRRCGLCLLGHRFLAEDRKPRAGSRARKPAAPPIGTDAPGAGPVESAVRAELEAIIDGFPEKVSRGMLEVAYALARRVDDPRVSATAASMCAARMREIVADVRGVVPEKPKERTVARIREKRNTGGLRAV